MAILKRFDGTYNLDVYVKAEDSPTGKALRVKRMGLQDKKGAELLHGEILKALVTVGSWDGGRKAPALAHVTHEPIRLEPKRSATLKAALDLAWDDPESGWASQAGGRRQYENAAVVVEIIGPSLQCAAVTRDHYMDAMAELKRRGDAPATVTRKLQAFHRTLHYAELKGWVKGRIRWKRSESRRRAFTYSPDVERQVIAYFRYDRDMRHLFGLGISCGMRAGELQSIEGRWFKKHLGLLVIPADRTKNGEPRSVVLTRRARAILRTRVAMHQAGKLFPNITTDQRVHAMQKAREDLGYGEERDFVFHATRHTHGSHLADKDVNLQDIMGQMGHLTPKMSLHYIHAAAASRKKNILGKIEGRGA